MNVPEQAIRLFFFAMSGAVRFRRERLAARWLQGRGIEIGALHRPLRVPAGTGVTYVDRMPVEQLLRHYPELKELPIRPVDVIDDGERLAAFPDRSQDFVIANHLLEHCEDPIGSLETWLRVLRISGIAYIAVPDQRFTFDRRRQPTSWQHVLRDRQDPAVSRSMHFREWAALDRSASPEVVAVRAGHIEQSGYSIHFHAWTADGLRDLFDRCRTEIGLPFAVRAFVRNGDETLVVLERTGTAG